MCLFQIIFLKYGKNNRQLSANWNEHILQKKRDFFGLSNTVEIVYNDGEGNWEFRRYIRLSL